MYEYQKENKVSHALEQEAFLLKTTLHLQSSMRREIRISADEESDNYHLVITDSQLSDLIESVRIVVNQEGINVLTEGLRNLIRYVEGTVPQLFARGFAASGDLKFPEASA